jgi:murein DD-endopeptidase MepM/ murein hydrolase activator NlpD
LEQTRQSTIFGKRREPHTVIIARGNEIRHFTVRPWLAALLGSVLSAVAIGYLLATSYLVLRDDLIGASIARQARLQHSYEDRISALRAQVDRITSRQLLDQRLMETKVSELLQRQTQLSRRHGRLSPILERAEAEAPAETRAPEAPPDRRAEADAARTPDPGRMASIASADATGFAYWNTRSESAGMFSAADRADMLFATINKSLRTIEHEQIDRVATLAEDADRTANAISAALEQAGLTVEDTGSTGIGGPLIAVDDQTTFETRVRELDEALSRLESLKKAALATPIHNPAQGVAISSSFGVRRDPLLGTPAMHAGIDFRVPYGGPVRAAGAGTVVSAGWNGGYGRMVEVEHADGMTTRYAHLSKITVKTGDRVERGSVVGKAGSSGRSTGPHLHYEVRRNGTAIDPLRFIKAGKKIANLL